MSLLTIDGTDYQVNISAYSETSSLGEKVEKRNFFDSLALFNSIYPKYQYKISMMIQGCSKETLGAIWNAYENTLVVDKYYKISKIDVAFTNQCYNISLEMVVYTPVWA